VIDLEKLETFLTVAKHGGFRGAAKHRGLSQSAVTQHIKQLERSLNAVLIDRSNAVSKLTTEGQALLPYAQMLIDISMKASDLFRRSSLTIGASSNVGIYLLQPYLKEFQHHCSVRLDIVIADNASIAEKLQRLEIDVAVMEWWDNRSGFTANIWRSEELVLIVPTSHPWASRSSVQVDELDGMEMIGGEKGTGTGRIIDRVFGDRDLRINVAMQLGSTEAVKHAVKAGLGVSLVLAGAVTDEVLNRQLSVVRIDGDTLQKDIYVIHRNCPSADSVESRFVDFLRQ
jgi:DNA-binding transcriptional LysR family regulator